MDIWNKKKRSQVMSRIRSKNTKPELLLRSSLHRLGLRYTLHDKNLPGKPDLVFPKYNTVVFVHGCFWHHHEKCIDGKIPKSKYWQDKILSTLQRDKKHKRVLKRSGWKVIIVWECEVEKKKFSASKLASVIRNNLEEQNTKKSHAHFNTSLLIQVLKSE